MPEKLNAREILKQHLEQKRKKNPSFSLRYLARKLELSPTFLSLLLSGKKPVPLSRMSAFAKALDLDLVEQRRIERMLLREQKLDESTRENLALSVDNEVLGALPSESFSGTSDQSALDEWYYLPILELVTCQGFTPSWISERLGLKTEVADRAWENLVKMNWVAEENGRWIKVTKRIRFPTTKTELRVRKHHARMLKKALHEIEHRTANEDFARRLMLGASVATNDESLRLAKNYLEEGLYKAADILTKGPADKVYYVSLQLFPLSRPSRNQN